MLLSAPRFALPETVAEAVGALAERPGAVLVAGGTELMPDLLWGRRAPAGFVSLRRVPGLRTVAVEPAGPGGAVLRVGSGVTAERLQGDDVVAAAPGLARAASSLGTPQVRTEATAGGNVVSALPYRNLLPVLLALDARLELRSADGTREVPFDGFVTAPGRTGLAAGEVLTGLRLEVRPGHQDYVKIGRRNAQYVATVSAAISCDLDGPSGVRLAFGNAGRTPVRHDDVDGIAALVYAGGASEEDLRAAVAAAVDPPEDAVASAEYRRHALGVLAVRLVRRAGGVT